ncbi:integrase [Kribbella qitaiheensis]|uniref:Integrase n=1 Tax=Kribbella qitaiheensis TaxID=1544730 RepID=A0A7G6WW60_9ACTN|nr:protein phosphatase 2C domain-containing protein [Kribbella qitaiheensis]QNE18225.1 integrase [Kribbella qitaiheensis]
MHPGPGSSQRPNEDSFAAVADLVIVADGATAPDGLGTGCVHDPRWYSRELTAQATAAHVRYRDASLADILSTAISATADAHASTCDPGHPGTPSSTVVMLRARAETLEWLVLGDATLVLETPHGLNAICDDRLFQTNKELRNQVLRTTADDPKRPARIAALVDAQRNFRNVEGGFWVAASDPNAAYKARADTERLAAGTTWRAALLTDGASAAVDTYGLTDWHGLLNLLDAAGPNGLLESVRKIEADDPAAQRYPRIKRSDDATVAYLTGAPE